jgi:hypothetical protein
MVICGSYMFESSVSKDMKKEKLTVIKSELQHIFLAYLLTLNIKKMKISVEQGRVATTLNIIKH